MQQTWHVYILRCADGTLYTGITTDIERRLKEHNSSDRGARYTRSRRPVRLAWSEEAASHAAASRREYDIRKMNRHGKQELLAGWLESAPDRSAAGRQFGHGSGKPC